MKIINKCPTCNKTAEIKSESKIGNLVIINYQCGHVRARPIPNATALGLISLDGKQPFKYQLEGASWAIKRNARVLIADEMGVGKTLQSFLVAKSDPIEFCPVLIICKSGLKAQMCKEAYRWCGWLFQIIENENDYILPGLQGYIISYDTLAYSEFTNKRGKVISRGIKEPEVWLEKINPRLVILDECQSVKNSESKRTQAVQKIARKVDHIIALSGTPILNHAGEYFPILNMIQPEKFPTKTHYIARWCDSYFSTSGVQKIGGIRDIQDFKNYTSDFIIRRTRKEVLPDLPAIDRRFRFEELGEKVEAAYKEEFKKFQDYQYYSQDSSFKKGGELLKYLNKMRHLTGIAKIPGVVEFVEEFLSETDRKIVVFTHHLDVMNEIVGRIKAFYPNVINLSSPVNQNLVDDFWKENNRVMIASTLAAGEGLNLQCCSDCIMVERQWNPPKEEQAEARFLRVGQLSNHVTATYFTAIGTIDEFFSELVEQKRSIVGSTLDGRETKWNEAEILKELAEILAAKGGKRWGW